MVLSMNKICLATLMAVSVFAGSQITKPTKAIVTVSAAAIKANRVAVVEKYPRKDCPVCKGKGWYISGDGIKKVDCGYCEESTQITFE